MDSITDRKRLRWEYLRKKRIAYGWAAAGIALFLLASWGTLAIAASMSSVIVPQFSLYFNHHFGKLVMALQLVIFPMLMTLALGYLCGFQIKRATTIPYVPPVSVDDETLPPPKS